MKKYFLILTSIFLVPYILQAKTPEMPEFKAIDFKPPTVEKHILTNGSTVFFLVDKELPLVSVSALVSVGTKFEDPSLPGLASLCGAMIRAGGVQNKSAEELDEELEFLAASVESGIGMESGSVGLSVLSKDLDRGLEIFADVLMRPAFDAQKLEIEKSKVIESIRRQNDNPFEIARRSFRKMVYGESHPMARAAQIQDIKRIQSTDLKKIYNQFFAPNNTIFSVSGDFDSAQMLQKLETLFSSWQKCALQTKQVQFNLPKAQNRNVGLVDKPLAQTSILMGKLGVSRQNPDFFALQVLNEILGGGGFSSRLYKEVRSKHGLAYWVGSSFSEGWDAGTVVAGCQTKNESVNDAIELILKEIDRLKTQPVSAEELKSAQDAIVNSFVFRYASSGAILAQQVDLFFYGYSPDYLENYTKNIEAVTAQDLQAVAQKYWDSSNFSIVVVGTNPKVEMPLDRWGKIQKLDITIHE